MPSRLLPHRAVLLALALILASCPGSDHKDDSTVDVKSPYDSIQCRRPPTIEKEYCDPPPNAFSQELYKCYNCDCTTGASVAACNPTNDDCRYFFDGCYPKSYFLCTPDASNEISALCLMCFFGSDDAGVKKCDRLTRLDAAL